MKNVIFDFGNVVFCWQPFRALSGIFADEPEMRRTLTEIGFYDWNIEQDRGRSWQDGLDLVRRDMPEHAHIFEAYHRGLKAAHSQQIPGMAELITALHARGVNLYGLTNAAVESYAAVRATVPVLDLMQDVVVSAIDKVIKPDAAIFELCITRNGLVPGESLFVDDSLANCDGARAVGLVAHHFKDTAGLQAELQGLGLL